MTPYYQDNAVTIYHGDCREILPSLEPVDLVLTDPPYAVMESYDSHRDTGLRLDKLIREFFPLVKDKTETISISCGVVNIWRYPRSTWILCWFNSAGSGRGPWGFSCWQPLLCYGPDPFLKSGSGCRPDFIEHSEASELNGHPCPKPLKFVSKWMQRVSFGKSVLDPFMGSGTTLRAAKDLGRKAIGIEIEERYCEIAARRMAQEVLELTA
jgi:site-specific DNA-methyltransferase (adenine-specific)